MQEHVQNSDSKVLFRVSVKEMGITDSGNHDWGVLDWDVEVIEDRNKNHFLFIDATELLKIEGLWSFRILGGNKLFLGEDLIGFIYRVRVELVNTYYGVLSASQWNQPWARQVLESKDISSEAVFQSILTRFGTQVVAADPADPEATKRAVADGFVVLQASSFSVEEWTNFFRTKSLRLAGAVFHSVDFKDINYNPKFLDSDSWPESMKKVSDYASQMAEFVIGVRNLQVVFIDDPSWMADACYGRVNASISLELEGRVLGPFNTGPISRRLTINLGQLGKDWCEKVCPTEANNGWGEEELDELLIHEFAHEMASDHLSVDYYNALCRVAAKLKTWVISNGKVRRI